MHYLFVSVDEFDRMVARGELLEWAVVHGRNRYGTPRRPVEERLAAGEPALLEIDLQGARQVRESDAGRALRVPRAAVASTSWSGGSSGGGPRTPRSASAG